MLSVHVAHVVPGLLRGGMELSMAKVISGLTGNGTRHTVICLKGSAEIASQFPPSTDIECMNARPNEPQLPFRIGKLIRAIKPNVIHSRNWGAWPDTVAGHLLTYPKRPLIHSFHGLGRADYVPLRRRIASYFLARMTTHLMTVSRQSKQTLISDWGWPADRIEVIPNGVDTGKFVPAQRRTGRMRTVIGTVGNLRRVKNHSLLIRACGILMQRGVAVELRIAGEGEERAQLRMVAESLGIGNVVHLSGYVNDTTSFLQDVDIFVLTSDSEQHPNALNEAMAVGLPCISTRVGCAADLLDNGRCGILVTPGSVDEVADGISSLIMSPATATAFGENARARVCEHFSLERMLEAYMHLYCRWSVAERQA